MADENSLGMQAGVLPCNCLNFSRAGGRGKGAQVVGADASQHVGLHIYGGFPTVPERKT